MKKRELAQELFPEKSAYNAVRSMNRMILGDPELLAKLTVEFNKARQAAITQEITEVINGANAQ